MRRFSPLSKGEDKEDFINVLTVDDDPVQLELLKMFFKIYDPAINIESITTPEETLEKLKTNKYDCIVADHKMPGMTGIELAQRIKGNLEIPFILYTGHGSEEIASDAFKASIDDYVKKESDPEHYKELAKRIRIAVERYRSENKAGRSARRKEIALPDFPKVEIKDKDVVITWEDGREELWGRTDTDKMSAGANKGIELGLKSISYVESRLADSIDEIVEELLEVGIPPKYLDRIVNEGYDGIKKLLIKLYYNRQDIGLNDKK